MNIYDNPQTEALVHEVCKAYNVTEQQLSATTGKRPSNNISRAKQVICYLNRSYGNAHYKTLMQLLGYADHTPICKNVKLIGDMMSVYVDVWSEVKKIERELISLNIIPAA